MNVRMSAFVYLSFAKSDIFSSNFYKVTCLTLSQMTNFGLMIKLEDFVDDNFRFDKNCRKFSERVENTVGKGEIARYEQFLLFSKCFQKPFTAET